MAISHLGFLFWELFGYAHCLFFCWWLVSFWLIYKSSLHIMDLILFQLYVFAYLFLVFILSSNLFMITLVEKQFLILR